MVYIPSYYDNQYLTGQRLCGAPFSQMASTPSSAAGNTTAVEVVAPPNFQGLYPNYLCSGLLPPTQTSARLGSVAATYALEHMGGSSHTYTREEFRARYARHFGPLTI